jgi:hypothetical protein
MRKTLFCSFLLLSAFILSSSFTSAQKSVSSTAKSAPSSAAIPESLKDLAVPKPVIKNVLVDDLGVSTLTWRVVIENTGNAPTTGTDNLEFYRNPGSGNPPELSAGSVSVPVIQAGETKDVSATLNPDPQNGNYTIKLVDSKGKVLQARPYGLGIPTMVIEDVKIAQDKSAWETVVRNTWLFTVGDIKVQGFKKATSGKVWEAVGESTISLLKGNNSLTVKAKANLAGADEFKVAVCLRRIKSEPYVEIISKTAIIQGANQPIRK